MHVKDFIDLQERFDSQSTVVQEMKEEMENQEKEKEKVAKKVTEKK